MFKYISSKKRQEKKPYICSWVSFQEFHKICEKDPMLQKYGSKKIRLSSANTHSMIKVSSQNMHIYYTCILAVFK